MAKDRIVTKPSGHTAGTRHQSKHGFSSLPIERIFAGLCCKCKIDYKTNFTFADTKIYGAL